MSQVEDLVRQAWSCSAEYGRQLSNHLPMALYALQGLGAEEARIARFHARARRRLRPKRPATRRFDDASWRSALGRHDHNAAYRDHFAAALAREGRAALLARTLPVLFEGVGGGAFHPLIRLGYALEAENDGEVAEALAAWAMAWLPLRPLDPSRQRHADPREALAALAEEPPGAEGSPLARLLAALRVRVSPIFRRMELVAGREDFAPFADCLRIDADSLDAIAVTVLDAFARGAGDFTLLHGVTSCHALRLVLPWVPDRGSALRYYFQALLAAVATVGLPAGDLPQVGTLPTWERIARRAIESDDDHTIKLVYSCRQEDRARGHPLYRWCAARKVGLLDV